MPGPDPRVSGALIPLGAERFGRSVSGFVSELWFWGSLLVSLSGLVSGTGFRISFRDKGFGVSSFVSGVGFRFRD